MAAQSDIDRIKDFALGPIAVSYARIGEIVKDGALMEEAIKMAKSIDISQDRAQTLSEMVRYCGKLAESLNDPALYDKVFGLIKWSRDGYEKQLLLDAILSSKLALADVERLRSLVSYYANEREKVSALASILKACSRPELIGQERNLKAPAIGE